MEAASHSAGNSTEAKLGTEGREYVASCLSQGTGLCSKLVKILDESGEVFTLLPESAVSSRIKDFAAGGIVSRRQVYSWFGRHVEALAQQTKDGSLVFQDVWADPDHFPVTSDQHRLFCASNVYYLLGASQITADQVIEVVRRITNFLMIASFCDVEIHLENRQNDRVASSGLIETIANRTRKSFISTYDQEGLVVWRRTPGN